MLMPYLGFEAKLIHEKSFSKMLPKVYFNFMDKFSLND